jgi:hypothetical protein
MGGRFRKYGDAKTQAPKNWLMRKNRPKGIGGVENRRPMRK